MAAALLNTPCNFVCSTGDCTSPALAACVFMQASISVALIRITRPYMDFLCCQLNSKQTIEPRSFIFSTCVCLSDWPRILSFYTGTIDNLGQWNLAYVSVRVLIQKQTNYKLIQNLIFSKGIFSNCRVEKENFFNTYINMRIKLKGKTSWVVKRIYFSLSNHPCAPRGSEKIIKMSQPLDLEDL